MGMNYYVVGKETNNISKSLFKTYEKLYNGDELDDVIRVAVMKKFKKTMNFLEENGLESRIELFEDCLDEAIHKFVCDIKYDVLDTLDIEEREKVHIGKSSYGWLFCFQTQHTEIEGIPVDWNNYEQVKKWLKEYVEKKKIFIIEDEDGNEMSVQEFIDKVDSKQKDHFNIENPDNFTYSQNVNGYRFSDRDFS